LHLKARGEEADKLIATLVAMFENGTDQ
jgi:hypothetical protein